MSSAFEEMLQLVRDYQRDQCQAAYAQARVTATQLLQTAHRTARQRMHARIQELRSNLARQRARAAAELATVERSHRSRCDAALIEGGWGPLLRAMQRRWQDPAARLQWVEHLAARARTLLPAGDWQVFHPRDWPVSEQQRFAGLCHPHASIRQFVAQDEITAGLRLCADGACLDGTLAGLLADRAAVESRLLAELAKSVSA